MVSRYGFSLIELIFAIVIIGITVLSLPMVNQVTSNTIENNLAQEAIFAAAVTVNQATSYKWDENSDIDDNLSSKVINTGDCNSSTKKMLGHIMRRCLNDTTIPTSAIGTDGNETESDDIDDRDTANVFTSIFETASNAFLTEAHGYKEDYESAISVTYSTFGDGVDVSNDMKRVTVTINDSDDEILTELTAYSANIGEVKPDSREFN